MSKSASAPEIKLAYHRALLLHHPDKQHLNGLSAGDANGTAQDVDIGLIQQAYTTLSSSSLRQAYDANRASSAAASAGPRPAQVVSLEEFDEEAQAGGNGSAWTYACRRGGKYVIREPDMERDQHLIGCSGCSEVVWVGYEVAEDEDDDT